MQMSGNVWLLRGAVAFLWVGVWICALSTSAAGATAPHYIVTNDDVTFTNGVSFYSLGSDGNLTLVQQVVTEWNRDWRRVFRHEPPQPAEQRE